MQSLKITDMTIDDLKSLIHQVVDEHLKQQQVESHDAPSGVESILKSIEQHRWTPPPGISKASQLIIEERDQWRQGM